MTYKGIKLGTLLAGLTSLAAMLQGEVVVGFEDVPLAVPPAVEYAGPGGGVYYNGSDGSGGFTSGGVRFLTVYDTQFGSWSGWAYSTTSDTETGTFMNGFSNITGGAATGDVFAIGFFSAFGATPTIQLPGAGWTLKEMAVTNATYPYRSMSDGDAFAKQFEDGDYFRLILTAYAGDGTELGTVVHYLADFREGTDPGYILSGWATVDLSPLNAGTTDSVVEIRLTFESSDVGDFGINTPTYVAVDDLVLDGGWGGYPVSTDGWVNTGAFLGWVYPVNEWVWLEQAKSWVYLPEPLAGSSGEWVFVPGS